MTKLISLYILIISDFVIAAEGGGHAAGHVSDLIAPFVNIFILGAFLIWKLKNPLSNYFVKKSNDVSEIMARASVKAKEAEMMFKMQQTKLEKVDEEISRIKTESQELARQFETEYRRSVDDRIKQLKEDASVKIETERKEMMDQVNSIMLDEVIARARGAVKNDPALSKTITENLIQG